MPAIHERNDMAFLPVSIEDMKERGWDRCDFVFVIGDAYVDHSSYGPAIISRVLESRGYRVGIIAQPDFKTEESIKILGEPRLGFLVCAGNMDSMVNHYTVAKKKRNRDFYSPGGKTGLRPDRATICYGNMIRRAFPKIPVIIGGIEASLRRMGHYDYWSDKIRRSILIESAADIISYGMGERSIAEIADALDSGIDVKDITFIRGTVYKTKSPEGLDNPVFLPSFEEILGDKRKYAESFYTQYCNTDPFTGRVLVEKYGAKEYVVQNPPQPPLSVKEMDEVYALPYMRAAHPMYDKDGGVPGFYEMKFSLTSNRGCFGGCNFCALTFHQGRIVQVRSHESLLEEAAVFTKDKDFKGYINDVGGPTADFRHPSCEKQMTKGTCKNRQCLTPKPCPNLKADHSDYIELLRKLRRVPGVKKVFIRSGIRFDYVLADKDSTFLNELVKNHVSGQLRVAPEHICNSVLELMGKPENAVYERFIAKYDGLNKKLGLKQFAVPYLMSSHPGSTMQDAVKLAEYLNKHKLSPEQVQDFYPTPSTMSTCMYYTGINPATGKEVFVERDPKRKEMQRALIQFRDPKNRALVEQALKIAGREDLIGYGPECLIRPAGKSGDVQRQRNKKHKK
jgi:uncharacterized radical SAM protein YgiQ